MADNGRLYVGFDEAFVESMKTLCARADYLLPNMTETSLLTGLPYQTEYDRSYIDTALKVLTELGAKNVILTGISYREGYTGVVVFETESIIIMSMKNSRKAVMVQEIFLHRPLQGL